MPSSASAACRADTRAQQDRRRADGAGGQGDAPPADQFWLAFACDVHADRPVAGDQDPVDQAVRPDGEVGPVPGGQQVGDRGGQAQAAPPVLRERADAGRLRVVVVGDLGEAEAAADLEEGALDRDQLIRPPAADRDRAAAPVQLRRALRVVFQPAEVRQHLRPAPLVVAQRRPLVVVGGHAAQRDRGVDSGRAADHPATRIGNGPAGHGLRGQPPVVRPQRHAPAVLQIGWGRLERRVVRARLQQQDAAGRFLRQPRRQHRTGRTATHDDVVDIPCGPDLLRVAARKR